MSKINIYQAFVSELEKKIPKKTLLAKFISEALFIEKESAYRRLRGDVQFSFSEVMCIAKKLNISVDQIMEVVPMKSRPFYLKLTNFAEPEEIDYQMAEEYNNVLKDICMEPMTEIGVSSKIIPDRFHIQHEHLRKFYLFKWIYLYGSRDQLKNYKNSKTSDRMIHILEEMYYLYEQIKFTYYIFDKSLFKDFIEDIAYFKNIELIDYEEVVSLKEELLSVTEHIERLALDGVNEYGNRVDFYISNVSFETGITCLDSSKYTLTFLRTFSVHDIASLDAFTLQQAKIWLQSLKRTSTKISESGEIERKKFFNEQRRIIETL